MVRKVSKVCALLAVMLMCFGCGHTRTSNVGLISFGDLEGKVISNSANGPTLQGSASGHVYYLSDAARDALKSGEYDTLVDVEVTTKTGIFVPSNRIVVKGTALNSKNFEQSGGEK